MRFNFFCSREITIIGFIFRLICSSQNKIILFKIAVHPSLCFFHIICNRLSLPVSARLSWKTAFINLLLPVPVFSVMLMLSCLVFCYSEMVLIAFYTTLVTLRLIHYLQALFITSYAFQ